MSAVSARWIPTLRRANTRPISREHQVAWWVAAALIALVIGLLVASVVYASAFFSRPFLGMMISPTQMVIGGQPTSTEPWNALSAGVRARDRLVALDGVPLAENPFDYAAARASIDAFLSRAQVGQTVAITVERASTGETLTFDVVLGVVPISDVMIYFFIPMVAGIIAVVASVLIMLVNAYTRVAITGAVIAALAGVMIFGLFDATIGSPIGPLWVVATCGVGGFLVRFGLLFPKPMPVVYRYPILRWLPVLVSIVLGLWGVSFALYPVQPADYAQSQVIATGTALIGSACLMVLLLEQRRRATTRLGRDQAGIVLVGLAMAVAPGGLWFVQALLRAVVPTVILPFTFEASFPFLLTMILSITFVLLQHRAPDSDRLFSQSVTYTVLLVGLVVGYFLLTLGASLIAIEVTPNNPLLIAFTLFVVSVLFLPVRARLQNRIDRIYFRQQRSLSELVEDFSQSLEDLGDTGETVDAFHAMVVRGVAPRHVLVFMQRQRGADYTAEGTDIRFAADSSIVEALKSAGISIVFEPGAPFPAALIAERARLETLKPAVITTMNSADELIGFVVLGAPSGRGYYNYDEVRFLTALTSQLSVVLERALVVESLEQRVRELNVLSQVGQAANFTNTLDDLLEFISAQTFRLLPVDFQYVVFFDTERTELYYGFYLEDDERDVQRENRRWALGNDLYSQIIRNGQPRFFDDYGQHRQMERLQFVDDNAQIHPFMAVPLVAQTHRLGVLAIGKRDLNPYTAEQVNTFNNLAALAATAFEKAQLFDEVNRRARQLAALNDISQQLVAAETDDVDALLMLITRSAVTILDSEAGSLLLADDDESGDMVFRAVVGGASDELTGQRVPAGRGLIGEVVRTGRPQISNQVQSDERWEGEVVQTNFRTQSILAVPLIAKDRTVGVLEVLNKRDGTTYREEEVDLLTTFASQAAVAIENARLFAMTGSALNQRLEELQTLEQIDRELARALDQREVGRITVKWAQQYTGAPAAVMGEVNISNLTMRVLGIRGYEPEDYPPGSDGNIWPLHKGIVRRVLRTGVEELADLRYDPEYTPSLRGAISQLTVPMLSGEEIIALLVLETNGEVPFTLLDLEFVKRLAERASISLANAQLYERIVRAAENKSEFVAFAAHELKNPLTSIKGFSDTLLNPRMAAVISDDQRTQFLSVIRSNAERMQAIIDDLRDIAASDAGKLQIAHEPLQFHTVIEDTIAPFSQMLIQKEQQIVQNVPEKLPTIYGDHKKLVQVLTNLISNAHKYSPPTTNIWLNVEVLQNYRMPSGVEMGECLYVSVKDSGIGMSPADLKRIFREDYFRSDDTRARAQKGTGLGMMITQRIIEGHGGRIWVESELDKGSNFQFVIPLQRYDAGKISSTSNTAVRKKIVMSSPGQVEQG